MRGLLSLRPGGQTRRADAPARGLAEPARAGDGRWTHHGGRDRRRCYRRVAHPTRGRTPPPLAQTTTGLRAVLSAPWAYDALQRALGVARYRKALVRDHFALFDGARVLDIGCGTGELLEALPGRIDYLGVDLSAAYVERAKRRADPRARFVCSDVDDLEPGDSGPFDRIIGTGLLHHLDDAQASRLLARAARALAPGGFLLMVDPTLVDGQSPLARALIVRERGRNVRAPDGYAALARPYFAKVDASTRHDLLRVPYTHCILRCAQGSASPAPRRLSPSAAAPCARPARAPAPGPSARSSPR